MVILVDIDVNLLAALGKDFLWEKPSACPKCGGSLWWHGFVLAYLACLPEGVFFRRLFCPHCLSVHRLRPKSHWRRFQSSILTIQQTAHFLPSGLWEKLGTLPIVFGIFCASRFQMRDTPSSMAQKKAKKMENLLIGRWVVRMKAQESIRVVEDINPLTR